MKQVNIDRSRDRYAQPNIYMERERERERERDRQIDRQTDRERERQKISEERKE